MIAADPAQALPQFYGGSQSIIAVDLEPDASMHLVPGEHVGVQILVCPEGWRDLFQNDEMMRLLVTPRRVATMSNRCEFIAQCGTEELLDPRGIHRAASELPGDGATW